MRKQTRFRPAAWSAVLILAGLLLPRATAFSQDEKLDTAAIRKIRLEGLTRSHVMDIAFHLTDASGNRLTASPGFNRAANWARQQLTDWGLTGATLDPWGEFGKGWELQKSYLAMTAPYYKPLIAYPKAWCEGTNGPKSASVLLISATDSAGLEKYKGQLTGRILIPAIDEVYQQSFKPDATRYTDEQLDSMSKVEMKPVDTAELRRRRAAFNRGPMAFLNTLRAEALKEGAIAILSQSPRGHDGTLFVQGGGPYQATSPANFLDMVIPLEDYTTIQRLLKAGIPVTLDADVKTKFYTDDTKGYNVIAEIKGTDKKLKDEVVMLGGHLDSWHSATGATDNAAGCTVMMEVVRILKTLGIQPRRTIRIALWSGEEEGLLGSRGYVKKTFADPAVMQLLPAHATFDAYFNIDNGTGKVRGIYLQGNEACRSIFTQWLQPFHDLGATTVTISNTGGTDHLSFDAVGLPGFQFIQDEIEYSTRTHHTNMDSYEHLREDDLKQIATIVAAFVYNTAQRDEKLPRKQLPAPRPAGRGF
ncbi:M20/M25/M40 family metallo-hydrolase [Puia dinghuensis]|uniref:Carboxypeptidase Q n=1 Tax=Puia dinghuensis TaxID=1792502 RepID=A0A8J2XRX7_9BACT|nr:M20/M25/M40 family metallo-hydrolase [Puia dinghuensis]GGA90872.1 peptidase M28 [Puia dinghuensis]